MAGVWGVSEQIQASHVKASALPTETIVSASNRVFVSKARFFIPLLSGVSSQPSRTRVISVSL